MVSQLDLEHVLIVEAYDGAMWRVTTRPLNQIINGFKGESYERVVTSFGLINIFFMLGSLSSDGFTLQLSAIEAMETIGMVTIERDYQP